MARQPPLDGSRALWVLTYTETLANDAECWRGHANVRPLLLGFQRWATLLLVLLLLALLLPA